MRLVARGTADTTSPSSQVDAIYSCPPALAAGSDHPALNHRGAWKVEGGFAALACPRWRLRLFLCRVLCGAVNGTRALDANWSAAAGGWAPWRWKKCPWQTASARAAREARRRTPVRGTCPGGGGGLRVGVVRVFLRQLCAKPISLHSAIQSELFEWMDEWMDG